MPTRLNPVTLIVGAGAGIGAACAHELARQSTGGLLLSDADENALALVADELDAAGAAPERVSTLAFEPMDAERWRQALGFIEAQYGRIDWVVAHAGAGPAQSHRDLNRAAAIFRALSPMLGRNIQGASIVFAASAAALKAQDGAEMLEFVSSCSQEAALSNIRVNAIAPGGGELPAWSNLPWLHELSRECGGELAAFERIGKLTPPLARYASSGNLARLIAKLVTDDAQVSGITVAVDGGYAL
jgi:NAD(P)-dependent dehydrogenase (short-subunit alcohol dehydrogenase family)